MIGSLEMLSGRAKRDYAREAQAAVADPEGQPAAIATTSNGSTTEPAEALVAM